MKNRLVGPTLLALVSVPFWLCWYHPPHVPPSFAQAAAAIHHGALPDFLHAVAWPPLAYGVMALPYGLTGVVSYQTAFLTVSLLLDAWAKWRLTSVLVERPVLFWSCTTACTVFLMPSYFASLDAIVASLCIMSLVSFSRAPEAPTGWVWLSGAIGVGITPLFLLPIGALWCRERGARWFDVLHGMCLCILLSAAPLIAAGLLGHAPSFAWWHAFVAEGISPSSSYAALAYVGSLLQGHFVVLPSFGQWVLSGERVAAWARLAPTLMVAAQGVVWWRLARTRSRTNDRVALALACASAMALLLTGPRLSTSSIAMVTPFVLAWSTHEAPRGRAWSMLLWTWACACTWQLSGREVAMAHGERALQLWLVIRAACIGWLLVECARGPTQSVAKEGQRKTWLVSKPRRRRA